MKRLVSINIILFLFSFEVLANIPNVVAFVNDQPITKYDFLSRKKLVLALNNIDISNSQIESTIHYGILDLLIEESLVLQHARATGNTITTETIENVILSIEEKNAMLSGSMKNYIEKNNLDIYSFKKQIEGELIKQNILNSLSESITTSTDEVNAFLINEKQYYNFEIEACIFTLKSPVRLLKSESELLKRFASKENSVSGKSLDYIISNTTRFYGKMFQLSKITRSILLDTQVKNLSMIYKEDNTFKVLFVNKKDLILPDDKLKEIKILLSNEKTYARVNQFFRELKLAAHIRISDNI